MNKRIKKKKEKQFQKHLANWKEFLDKCNELDICCAVINTSTGKVEYLQDSKGNMYE